MNFEKSLEITKECEKHIPGGVNSPVRAGKAVGVNPPIIVRGDKSKLYDEDGNTYIDYVGSYGPMILGHNKKEVREAISSALDDSLSFGATTKKELEMAMLIKEINPAIDLIRMVNSGTEATMSAIRLARGYTGKSKIVKFSGNYHGHADSLLVKAGSGIATQGISSSKGILENTAENTVVIEFNDIEALKEVFKRYDGELAAVIVELIGGNMGVVPGDNQFIQTLRNLTKENNVVLIVDEVMTGFRVNLRGAQHLYGIDGDLVCYGKIIGGGMPIGAFGGKREIMEHLAPLGSVYQAGTLSGNPIAMTSGLTTLRILRDNPDIYEHLENLGKKLEDGINELIKKFNIEATVNRVGSMITLFFTKDKVKNFTDACKCNEKRFAEFYKGMLNRGIFLPPSQYEAFFISHGHSDEDIEYTLKSIEEVFGEIIK